MADHLCTDGALNASDAASALARLDLDLQPAYHFERTVLDTFDGRLHDAGLRLDAFASPDLELILTGDADMPPARLYVDGVPRFAADLPSGPLAGRLGAITKERALLPLMTVRGRCRTALRRDRRDKVTVVARLYDQVRVDGRPARDEAHPRWALEVSGVAGHDAALAQVLDRLASRGLAAEPGDLVAYVAARAGIDLTGRHSSPTVPLDPREPAAEAFRRVLGNLADSIDTNLAGTIADTDPEFLHELRVAVRRTRAVLGEAEKALPEDLRAEYREGFKWLGLVTGPPRDLAVQVLGWDDLVRPLTAADPAGLAAIQAEIERQRDASQRALVKDLRSARYRHLMDRWRAVLAAPLRADDRPRPVGPLVARHIERAQERVITAGRAITPSSPATDLHDLRKDAKRLRYQLECFGSLLADKPRKAFVQRLKGLQDNLGEHQDAEVQVGRLHDLAVELHTKPRVGRAALLALGQLTEVLEQRRAAEREDFADRFRAYDDKRTAKALADLLRPLRAKP